MAPLGVLVYVVFFFFGRWVVSGGVSGCFLPSARLQNTQTVQRNAYEELEAGGFVEGRKDLGLSASSDINERDFVKGAERTTASDKNKL